MAAMAIPAAAATPSMTISDFLSAVALSELVAALRLAEAQSPLEHPLLLPPLLPLESSVVDEVSGFFGGG